MMNRRLELVIEKDRLELVMNRRLQYASPCRSHDVRQSSNAMQLIFVGTENSRTINLLKGQNLQTCKVLRLCHTINNIDN